MLKDLLLQLYKNEKSWPNVIDSTKQQAMKWLFAIKAVPIFSKFSILISIDELLFSRTIKLVHLLSWRGKTQDLQNIRFQSSTLFLTSISSTRMVNAVNTTGPVNCEMFANT